MKGFYFLSVVLFVTLSTCIGNRVEIENPAPPNNENTVPSSERSQLEETLIRKMNAKCSQRDISSCVMLKLVTYMNKMLKKAAISVGDDIEITKNSSVDEENTSKVVKSRSTGESDDDQVTQLLLDKMWSFASSRSLRWKMFDDAEFVITNSPDVDGGMKMGMSIQTPTTGSGRGKNKNLAPFLAAAAMKIGLLGGLAFKGLALLVGKALLVSKIALLLAGIIGLKKLFSHQKHVTYEVVSHPHHSHESSGSHDSYGGEYGRELGRSENSAHELAYSAHVPQDKPEKLQQSGENAQDSQKTKNVSFTDKSSTNKFAHA